MTGKGGVGKSTIAAGLALKYSQAGHKTLLVEMGKISFYHDFFHPQAVGYSPQKTKYGFDVAHWDGISCLQEYARHLLKVESLYKLLFENAVSKALINIAPGLPELSILGKITSGERRIGPSLNYDCLVVDAHASGHFLALLRAPLGLGQAIRFGPMGEQTKSIQNVLKDPKICHYSIVCTPEEMPVIETKELQQALTDEFQISADIILNKVWPTTEGPQEFEGQPEATSNQAKKFNDYGEKRRHAEKKNITKISAEKILARTPQIFSMSSEEVLLKIVSAWPETVVTHG